MKIKINNKILCLPPFISTSWDQVRCLKIEIEPLTNRELLVISLLDGTIVRLADLGRQLTEAIFQTHLAYLESVTELPPVKDPLTQILEQAKQVAKKGLFNLENFAALLHHNPEQAHLPPLPRDVLAKIAETGKIITPAEAAHLPKPEGDCHCIHCQIARTLQESIAHYDEMSGEEVSADELQFRLWDIQNTGENLYVVSNPENPSEQFNVFLGSPVGCTCGTSHCEHIRAVLNS